MIFSIDNANPVAMREAAAASNREFTPEQRIGLTMTCVPLVRALRTRIWVYGLLWCTAGVVLALLAIPALRLGSLMLAIALLVYGGCLAVCSVLRIVECRSLAALTEVGRSEIRRKVWLFFNLGVFFVALIMLMVALISPSSDVWVTIPSSVFVMVVSISPVWEWLFVYRVIATSRGLLEDFCRALSARYPRAEEMTSLSDVLDALYFLGRLQQKGFVRNEVFVVVRDELIGLDLPQAPTMNASPSPTAAAPAPAALPSYGGGSSSSLVVSSRPW